MSARGSVGGIAASEVASVVAARQRMARTRRSLEKKVAQKATVKRKTLVLMMRKAVMTEMRTMERDVILTSRSSVGIPAT